MIVLKPGASLRGLTVHTMWAAMVTSQAIGREAGLDTIITSTNDGQHSLTSLHWSGNAVDIRSKHLPSAAAKKRVRDAVAAALGPDYDVVLEQLGHPNEHYHVEWQPKGPPR